MIKYLVESSNPALSLYVNWRKLIIPLTRKQVILISSTINQFIDRIYPRNNATVYMTDQDHGFKIFFLCGVIHEKDFSYSTFSSLRQYIL